MKTKISSNIKYLRESEGLSQSDFGKKFGVTRDNIASYERGSEPKLDFLDQIVDYFHTTYKDLIHSDLSKISPNSAPNLYTEEDDNESAAYKEISQQMVSLLIKETRELSAENALLKEENARLKNKQARSSS